MALRLMIMSDKAMAAILNQAHASHRLAHTWFLEIALVCMLVCVRVYVYVCSPEGISNQCVR